MQGYSGHTLKMVNKEGEWVYVQIHCLSQQGVRFLEQDEAVRLAGAKPDYAIEDLFDAISAGDHPRWKCYVQGAYVFPEPLVSLIKRDSDDGT